MTSIHDLVGDLVAAQAALREIHREHLAYYGELLPHVFMAEVTRWLLVHGPDARVLDALERNLASGDEEVENVIAVSFVEILEPEHEAVRAALGPKLRECLQTLECRSPDHPDHRCE